MKKFLAVVVPVILIASLMSTMLVAARPTGAWRPEPWDGQGGWPTDTVTLPMLTGGNTGAFEVWVRLQYWNADATVLEWSSRAARGVGAVNMRHNYAGDVGGRGEGGQFPGEFRNVITQIPAGLVVEATGRYHNAWSPGINPEFWVEVVATWVDQWGVQRWYQGYMINSMLVCPHRVDNLGYSVEAATWRPTW